MSNFSPFRILLADDDPVVRRSLQVIIEADPAFSVIGSAADGAEAALLYNTLKPDVVLLDIRMQPVDGLVGGEQILAADPDARILYLTTFSDDEYIIRALRQGARGYLLKQRFESITAALHAVCAGQSVFGDDIVARIPGLMREGEKPAGPDQPGRAKVLTGLTEREQEVVQRVAEGLNNREIAERLYLSEGTVRNLISVVLEKLRLRDRTQLAIYYYRALRD